MALSLMLRNSSKIRGKFLKSFWNSTRLSALPRCTFQIQKTQNFTQFLNKNNTNTLSFAGKCKMQFINVTQQTKRSMSSDHSKLWTVERIVSLMLLGVIPATFICPNNILDNLFAVLTVIHFHWGLEAIIIDYARPVILGPLLPKVALALLYMVSAFTLGGLLYYNHTQIGIGCTFRNLWSITGCPEDNAQNREE